MIIKEKKLIQMRKAIDSKGVGAKRKMAKAVGVTESAITLLFKHGEISESHYTNACEFLNVKP